MAQNISDSRPKTFLTSSGDRTDGQLSPVFGYVALVCLWLGSFMMMRMTNDGRAMLDHALFSSLITLIPFCLGIMLFQSYELSITTHSVKWETYIIPRVWAESWEEPVQNYKSISLEHTIPVNDLWPPKYVVARLLFPKCITKKNPNEADRRFNEKKFTIVYLKHALNPRRNVCLKRFDAEDVDQINKYCLYASEKLNVSIDS